MKLNKKVQPTTYKNSGKLIRIEMDEKVLINDKRLTPTMELLRSGKTQLFREKNKDDNTFIGESNCDVSLEHENKAMYAKLINKQWHWVNGCGECNGKERGWPTYVECDKHDVCSVCSISAKELKGSVWGGSKGWICKPCHEAKKLEIRKEAFAELNGEEPDCSYSDVILCPHCGSLISSDDQYESTELECHVCEGELYLEVDHTVNYSTTIKGKRITK